MEGWLRLISIAGLTARTASRPFRPDVGRTCAQNLNGGLLVTPPPVPGPAGRGLAPVVRMGSRPRRRAQLPM